MWQEFCRCLEALELETVDFDLVSSNNTQRSDGQDSSERT